MHPNIKTIIYVIFCVIFTSCGYLLLFFDLFEGGGGPAGAVVVVIIIPALIGVLVAGIIVAVGVYRKPKQRLIILCLTMIVPLIFEVGRGVSSSIERSQRDLYAYHLRELDKEYEQAWKELQTPSKVEQVIEKAKEKIGISDSVDRSITQNNMALLMALGMKYPEYRKRYMATVKDNPNLSCGPSKTLAEHYQPLTEGEFIWLFERLSDIGYDDPAEFCLRYSNHDDFSYERMLELGFLNAAQLRVALSDIEHEDILEMIQLTRSVESRQHRVNLVVGILEHADIFKRNRLFNTLFYANQSIVLLRDDPDLSVYVNILRKRLIEINKTVIDPEEKWKFDIHQPVLFTYIDLLDIQKNNQEPLQEYMDEFPHFLTEYYQKKVAEREDYTGPREIAFRAFAPSMRPEIIEHSPYQNEPYTLIYKNRLVDQGTTNNFGCITYVFNDAIPGDFVQISAYNQSWHFPIGMNLKWDDPELIYFYLSQRGYAGYYKRQIVEHEPDKEAVIKNFQHSQSIEETGILDSKTIAVLKKNYEEVYSAKYCN
ncbi:peptidoglycan-binding protein [Amylibacter sp. SFDW26]|uniref:hypothetical protein n=1 Tax=Amylibacter sp. SFDW26 TaxID=2652722 RepID=UPI001261FD6E|nr:hypothetical protein [Amylibacter sp. SFDW26]KAB7616095.1 peptidoglycan-binding protein [Amylibacter sp. SFDW26]